MSKTFPVERIPLLGAALGDALGAGVEGGRALARALKEDPGSIGRRFLPYSPYGFNPSELTDDTQMAWAAFQELELGRPDLSEATGRREFAERIREAYWTWFQSKPPDIGIATSDALRRNTVEGGWVSWNGGQSAGNGSLMRATAPFAAGYRGASLLLASALDSSLTHPDPRCVAACIWYTATLERATHLDDPARFRDAAEHGLTALEQGDVRAWLAATASANADAMRIFLTRWSEGKAMVREAVERALAGDHVDCTQTARDEWPTGYVISSLSQAAWAASQGDRADEAIRLAVLHGGQDADTIGAIAGGLVGARFGSRALDHWDPELLAQLRLGHRWSGSPVAAPFLKLLGRRRV